MRKLFSNKWIYYIEKHRVINSVIKMTFFAHGGISIKLFVLYLHIIYECLSYKFHPYLILTVHTKVESVVYQVLMQDMMAITLKLRSPIHNYFKHCALHADFQQQCSESFLKRLRVSQFCSSLPTSMSNHYQHDPTFFK